MIKLLRDIWLMFERNMRTTLRNPLRISFGLFQPLCFLFLFAPLVENVLGHAGQEGNSLTFFIPGLLVMIGLFSGAFVGFSMIGDLRSGIIERLQVTPMSRLALLLGKALHDVTILLAQSCAIIVVAFLMGLKASFVGIVCALLLVALVGLATACFSYTLALALRNEFVLAPVINFFLLPLQLLSGIMLPVLFAPQWLQNIAKFNPVAHAVTAARALFNGSFATYSVFLGFTCMLILACLSVYAAVRSIRNAMV